METRGRRCAAASCWIASSTRSTTRSSRRRAASRRSCRPSSISTGVSCARCQPSALCACRLRLLVMRAYARGRYVRGVWAEALAPGPRQQRHRAPRHQAGKHPLHGKQQGLGGEAGRLRPVALLRGRGPQPGPHPHDVAGAPRPPLPPALRPPATSRNLRGLPCRGRVLARVWRLVRWGWGEEERGLS
jgi:hypothetical protein